MKKANERLRRKRHSIPHDSR